MTRRELFEETELAGVNIRINKLDPQTACYWGNRLLADFQRIIEESENNQQAESRMALAVQNLTNSKKDFKDWQDDFLSAVEYRINNRWFPLKGDDGHYAEGLTAKHLLTLTFQSFAFSTKDFFQEEGTEKAPEPPIQEPVTSYPSIPVANTSTPSFTFQSSTVTGNSTNYGTEPTTLPIGSRLSS